MALDACKTTTPDPDNGVSNASYRQCITRVETNTAAICSRLKVAKAQDLANPKPVHASDWWDALIGEEQATDDLCVGTLKGANQ